MDVVLPKPGRYVVAVSGGVDSMALLNILAAQPGQDLIVAHFDHGIRSDSAMDRSLVESVAGKLGVPFVCREGKLGSGASEATAREARYKFLRQVMEDQKAEAIITAHHQDDLIETAILNMLRGTGRKGITALKDQSDILRPLLNVSKEELIKYAQLNNLEWREDSTNMDTAYLRNYVRHNLVPKLDQSGRQDLINIIYNLKSTNEVIDALLVKYLHAELSRGLIIQAPNEVAKEIMAEWLRQHDVRDFDRKIIEKLVVAAKTAEPGKKFPVLKGRYMVVYKNRLALEGPER